jgi:hypothetical protein
MHAPGHIRDAFCELVEEGETTVEFYGKQSYAHVDAMSTDELLWWLSGQLWNCTDCLPGSVCGDLDISQGSTYARATRHVRQV